MRDILFVCILDSFHYLHNEDLNETIDLSRNNIAWQTDREVRFRNDSNLAGDLEGTNRHPNWPYNVSGENDRTNTLVMYMYTHEEIFAVYTYYYKSVCVTNVEVAKYCADYIDSLYTLGGTG